MAFDGGFTRKMTAELVEARLAHVDKIYQPSRDELVFLLRKKGFNKKLLISARSGAARVQFTESRFENPAVPPMFCMLVRKHFLSAKLIDVVQNGLERIIELVFESLNEMGDLVRQRIVCELIGNQSNIILVGADGRILDSVRRSDIETAKRLIQPGAVYEYPDSQGKLNPLENDSGSIVDELCKRGELPLSRALLDTLDGLSPLICREISHRTGYMDAAVFETPSTDIARKLEVFLSELKSGGSPALLLNADGSPADFSYINIQQYSGGYTVRECESYSALLDRYYSERENAERVRKAGADIIKLVGNLKNRAAKRRGIREQELDACADREKLRIYGELIKANLHMIRQGSNFAEVQNFYDPNLDFIRIPLDPAISPTANATKYFKDYKKSYTAEQTLTELIGKDGEEIEYLESVLDSISRCSSVSDIAEIRDELSEAGYIRIQSTKRKKENVSAPREFSCPEGYRILVGRNNVQNDYITTRLASKNDTWFHVKGIPGSHVIVMNGGCEISDETLLFAAGLAAKNSKAASSSNVPVDYTPVKFVKKPSGAKPGMVIYTTNKTLFVTPQEVEE